MKFYVRCAFCLPTAVKTRILGLALDLEKLNPEAGEPGSPATDAAAVTTVVYNHIYGDGNNIAVASHDVRQHIERVREGDVDSLIDALKRLGTTNGDVQTLQQAILDDAIEPTEKGPRTARAGLPRYRRATHGQRHRQGRHRSCG